MFWELIGAIALGFGAAGFAMALRKISGGRLPGWIIPAAAGAGMLGYSAYMDYAWADRTRDTLPDGLTVVSEAAAPTWFKPWTYLAPPVERLAALDVAGAQTNPKLPQMRLSTMYLYDRTMPPRPASVLADCGGRRLGLAHEEAAFGADGLPDKVLWEDVTAEDPALSALCVD